MAADAPASPQFDLTKYHNYEETTKSLRDFQSSHSSLAKLISAGKSFQGKELWVMEITNQKTGKSNEKPAIFLSGGLRGDEVVGAEVCLYTIQYLLENYSADDRVKNLIEEKVFYIMPAINPDACDFSIRNSGKAMIKNFRPTDEDRDGKNDEDPADDLNKDGFISWMRVKDDKGDFKICKDDPRMMIPVNKSKDEKGEYKLYVEGSDDDIDKQYNEDGAGGTDLNSNFPVGWKMDFEQPGAGMYPGSEPESEAVMKFMIDHPNVAIVVIYRSGDGMLYRPYDHLADKEIPKPDLEIYEMLGNKYKKLTGFEMTHSFPEAEKKERGSEVPNEEEKLIAELENELPGELRVTDILKMGNLQELIKTLDAQMYIQQNGISDATVKKLIRLQEIKTKSEKQKAQPKAMKAKEAVFGTFLDWAYKDYNAYALSPSVWTVPAEFEAKGDSINTAIQYDLAWLNFLEKEQTGKGFIHWKPFKHPQLGEVEIGGFIEFYKKNPPAGKRLESVCQQNALFAVELAALTPSLLIKEIEIKPIQVLKGATEAIASTDANGVIKITQGNKKIAENALIAEIKIKVENIGPLGTRNALAKRTRYAQQPPRSVLAYLESKDNNLEILSMPKVLRLGVIEGKETKDLAWEKEEREERAQRPSPIMMEESEEQSEEGGPESDEPTIKSGTWLVKINGGSAELIVRVASEKGGTIMKKVPLKF
jgi:hypothetical protein